MSRKKVDVTEILPHYNNFYKIDKPDLTTRAGRRGARGEVEAILQDLSSRQPLRRFKSARKYVKEMQKIQEANEAKQLYNLQQKAIKDSNSVTENQRQQVQEGLRDRKTRRWFRKFRRWDEEDFKEQASNMYADTERNFKAQIKQLYNYSPNEDKMRYINNLNKYAYLPDQNMNELHFEGVRGPANIEVIGRRPKVKSAKTNINVDALNAEIRDIEEALRTNDFTKFYDNSHYYENRDSFESEKDYHVKLGRLAAIALADVHAQQYNYSGGMNEDRLLWLSQVNANQSPESITMHDFKSNPVSREDLIWLHNSPTNREKIKAKLNNRLRELKE